MSILQTITRGRTAQPPRVILYGMEGIGKSTFAANFPSPIFIQTEDGLGNIECARFPLATAYVDVIEQLTALVTERTEFKTVVVDSLDWLERLIWDRVCQDAKVESIESIGYGRGYTIALNYWRRVVDLLGKLRERGFIVLLLAHAVAENYSDPEVSGLTRFTPRLHKTARSLLAEYVDLILLATRKFGAANGDSNNPRVVRSEATPYQVAKSRYSIPPELPLDARVVLEAIRESIRTGRQPQNVEESEVESDDSNEVEEEPTGKKYKVAAQQYRLTVSDSAAAISELLENPYRQPRKQGVLL